MKHTLAIATLLPSLLACGESDASAPCPAAMATLASSADWRSTVVARLGEASSDSVAKAVFGGMSADDSSYFAGFEGDVVHSFSSFSAASVRMPVAGFLKLAADTTARASRIQWVNFGLPEFANEACR